MKRRKNKHHNRHMDPQTPNKAPQESPNTTAEEPQVEILDDVPQAVDQEQAAQQEAATDEKEAKITELEQAVEKEKKEYLFLMAEFDNFRKRTVKEKSDIIRNAAESALKGLLPIIDDFERALAAEQNSQAKEGMELIYNKLIKYLTSNGVKAIESTGQEFNPDLHEAIAMVPGDEQMKGKVIDTPEKGYMMNDKVLRHAKVAVGA